MQLRPKLDAHTALANMAEIEPCYGPQEARVEAERCLYCFDAPCIHACPTGIDVPAFIKRIALGNTVGAARTILTANVLGASCARVCPTEVLCEGACVLLDRDQKPIKIGRLQRFATDHVYDRGIRVLSASAQKTGKRIALIGAGPASLSCAAELARLGHSAVIFERSPRAGGLNTYGIAYYKMTPAVSLAEVALVESLGVEIRTGVDVGSDVTIETLEREFDALFVGVGLGSTQRLGIPGEGLPEVVDALAFIRELHVRPLHEIPIGARVAVIGCGNTAIDAVTQARRLGATTATIVYRRGPAEMSAYAFEYELAKREACEFVFHATPIEILARDGHVVGLKLARTEASENGGLRVVPNSEYTLECDLVIKALGQEKQRAWLERHLPGVELDSSGAVVRDFATGRTSRARVFAGGDVANGGSEVVDAVADGKRAARGIHASLTGAAIAGPVQTTRHGVAGSPRDAGLASSTRVGELERQYHEKARHG